MTIDDHYIYTVTGMTVYVWDKATNKLVCELICDSNVEAVAVDEQFVYTGLGNGAVQVWKRDMEWKRGESGALVGVLGIDGENKTGGVFLGGNAWPLLAHHIITFGLLWKHAAVYYNVLILNLLTLQTIMSGHNAVQATGGGNKANKAEDENEDVDAAVNDEAPHVACDTARAIRWRPQVRDWIMRWFCSETVLQQYGLIWCDWNQLYQALMEKPSAPDVGVMDLRRGGLEWAVLWTPYGLLQLSKSEAGRKFEREMLEEWRRQREQLTQLLGLELPPKVREAKSFRDLLDA